MQTFTSIKWNWFSAGIASKTNVASSQVRALLARQRVLCDMGRQIWQLWLGAGESLCDALLLTMDVGRWSNRRGLCRLAGGRQWGWLLAGRYKFADHQRRSGLSPATPLESLQSEAFGARLGPCFDDAAAVEAFPLCLYLRLGLQLLFAPLWTHRPFLFTQKHHIEFCKPFHSKVSGFRYCVRTWLARSKFCYIWCLQSRSLDPMARSWARCNMAVHKNIFSQVHFSFCDCQFWVVWSEKLSNRLLFQSEGLPVARRGLWGVPCHGWRCNQKGTPSYLDPGWWKGLLGFTEKQLTRRTTTTPLH